MASSIKLCYEALKNKYPNKKIIAIFQPHQINRILRERESFQKSLKLFDEVIIYDIYAARENLIEQLDNFKYLNIENANTISEL
jgi:UDP-N-acetylmuramate--alanine ligase